MSACIIPVAPEFQDPTASPNYAPVLESATPALGSLVTIPTMLQFEVTATDPNLDDNLYFRWFVDYPPNTANVTHEIGDDGEVAHPVDGTAIQALIKVTVDCLDGLASTVNSLHQLELLVADRPFLPSPSIDQVPSPGFVISANWTFQINCQSATSQ
jgi:hypothetical protein